MRSPYEILVNAIEKRPVLVFTIFIAMMLAALAGTSLVSMETGSDTYMDRNSERGILLDKYTKGFGSQSIMLLVEGDNVLDPAVLHYMQRLQEDVARQRYIAGVTGVADLVTQGNGGTLPNSGAEVDAALARAPPQVVSRYVPSRLMTIVAATLDPGLTQETQNTVIGNTLEIVRLSDPPPGVTVTVTGDPAFQQQMSQEMGTSMGTLIIAAMILMVVAVGVFFSHVRYRFLPVVLVGCGLVLTFGILGFLRMPISMVSIGAFPVLIGIGIDYAINMQARFDEEVRKSSIHEAVRITVTKTGPSILFAMLSTSMGFIALWISPVPMIRSFGLACVIGVMSCYLVSLIGVPVIGVLLKYRPKYEPVKDKPGKDAHAMDRYSNFLGDLAGKVAKNPVPVLLLCGLIAIVGFQMDGEIKINTNEDTFVPPDMPAIIDLNKVSRTMGSTSTVPIYVRGDNVLSPDTLEWMDGFQTYEETHNSKITGSTSIATLVRQYNSGILPGTTGELQTVLSAIPEASKSRYLAGQTEAIIEFSTVAMENEVALSMVDEMKQDIAWNSPPPGVSVSMTGMGEMFTNLIREISAGKTQMTLLAFILIFAFLVLVYRKFGSAIIPVIPIMLIVGWNGLIMYILKIDYTPMTATLGSMAIGVASEYTILIMERCNEERAKGLPLMDAISHSVRQIGTAITVSGISTVCGFAALILSSFNIISNFGMVTVLSVGFSLIGAIIVMPAIIVLVGGLGRKKEGSLQGETGSPATVPPVRESG